MSRFSLDPPPDESWPPCQYCLGDPETCPCLERRSCPWCLAPVSEPGALCDECQGFVRFAFPGEPPRLEPR